MIVGGWAKRPMAKRRRARVGVMRCLRACGARPSAGGEAEVRWPIGEGREITREVVFSEGRGLRARIARP